MNKKKFVLSFYSNKQNLLKQDFEVICRIKKSFDGDNACFLKSSDIDSLNRIYKSTKLILPRKIKIQKTHKNAEINFLEKCKTNTRLYSEWQLRIKLLQKLRRCSNPNNKGSALVITENAECEAYYRKLVPLDSTFYMSFLCFPIYEIYNEIINEETKDKA